MVKKSKWLKNIKNIDSSDLSFLGHWQSDIGKILDSGVEEKTYDWCYISWVVGPYGFFISKYINCI